MAKPIGEPEEILEFVEPGGDGADDDFLVNSFGAGLEHLIHGCPSRNVAPVGIDRDLRRKDVPGLQVEEASRGPSVDLFLCVRTMVDSIGPDDE